MLNFFKKISWTAIHKYTQDEGVDTDSAFRVYKSSPDRVTVQVRGPLRKSDNEAGAFGVIASAMLNREELTEMRDACNECLEALS